VHHAWLPQDTHSYPPGTHWHTAGWGYLLVRLHGRRDTLSKGDPRDVSHHRWCQEWQQPVLSVHGQELQRQGPMAVHDSPWATRQSHAGM
jgi:hypothetical protein